jgi:hypothetical protein
VNHLIVRNIVSMKFKTIKYKELHCKVTLQNGKMYIAWASNFFMTKDHSPYCGLVHGQPVAK